MAHSEDVPKVTRRALNEHWACPVCQYDLFGTAGEPYRCPECGNTVSFDELAGFGKKRRRSWIFAYVVSLVVGGALWTGLSIISGGREVWDSAAYWQIGVPLLLLISAALGYTWPQRPWRWSCVVVGVQAMFIFLPGLLQGFMPLLPVGICFTVALGILSAACSYGGAAVRTIRE